MAENRVANQYWPERIEIVADLPKTPAGTIQKFSYVRRRRRPATSRRMTLRDRSLAGQRRIRGRRKKRKTTRPLFEPL
jgi:hypothetical protein